MKITVKSVEEVSGLLRVKVSTEYGDEDFGMDLSMKKADPVTGNPKWYFEVVRLLKNKYQDSKPPISGEEMIGEELEI